MSQNLMSAFVVKCNIGSSKFHVVAQCLEVVQCLRCVYFGPEKERSIVGNAATSESKSGSLHVHFQFKSSLFLADTVALQ